MVKDLLLTTKSWHHTWHSLTLGMTKLKVLMPLLPLPLPLPLPQLLCVAAMGAA